MCEYISVYLYPAGVDRYKTAVSWSNEQLKGLCRFSERITSMLIDQHTEGNMIVQSLSCWQQGCSANKIHSYRNDSCVKPNAKQQGLDHFLKSTNVVASSPD